MNVHVQLFFFVFVATFNIVFGAAVMRAHNSTGLTPFTFLGKCAVPAGYGVPTLPELGGLNTLSSRKCMTNSFSTTTEVSALASAIRKRRACCVKKHGVGKCTTLKKYGSAEVAICGEAGWCHPCGMVAVLVADISRSCKWGDGWDVWAAGTWNVKPKGKGSIVVFGI